MTPSLAGFREASRVCSLSALLTVGLGAELYCSETSTPPPPPSCLRDADGRVFFSLRCSVHHRRIGEPFPFVCVGHVSADTAPWEGRRGRRLAELPSGFSPALLKWSLPPGGTLIRLLTNRLFSIILDPGSHPEFQVLWRAGPRGRLLQEPLPGAARGGRAVCFLHPSQHSAGNQVNGARLHPGLSVASGSTASGVLASVGLGAGASQIQTIAPRCSAVLAVGSAWGKQASHRSACERMGSSPSRMASRWRQGCSVRPVLVVRGAFPTPWPEPGAGFFPVQSPVGRGFGTSPMFRALVGESYVFFCLTAGIPVKRCPCRLSSISASPFVELPPSGALATFCPGSPFYTEVFSPSYFSRPNLLSGKRNQTAYILQTLKWPEVLEVFFWKVGKGQFPISSFDLGRAGSDEVRTRWRVFLLLRCSPPRPAARG